MVYTVHIQYHDVVYHMHFMQQNLEDTTNKTTTPHTESHSQQSAG